MTLSSLGRASGIAAVALLLAACDGLSQSQSTVPSTPLSMRQIAQYSKQSQGNLLYVSAAKTSYVLSYPAGKLVGTIAETGEGVCADESGNVYLLSKDSVLVYAHGSTTPSQTFTLPSEGQGCTIDPLTGDLAVTLQSQLSIAVFTTPYEQPALYQFYRFAPYFCSYDNAGNLFIDGYEGDNAGLAELPAGSDKISYLSISIPSNYSPKTLQWDGTYLTMEVQGPQKITPHVAIDRLSVSGSAATVVGSTTIKGVKHHVGPSWVYNNRASIIYSISGDQFPNIGVWNYPKGGKPVHRIKEVAGRQAFLTGLAVSAGR